ncbi:MAG: DUF445 domain-containing protein [Bacillota bacterium]
MLIQWLFIPLIGAFIGWITNVLAIRAIFHPYKEIRIPLLTLSFQGLIPKYRDELAQNIGQVIEQKLLSWEDLFGWLSNDETQARMVNMITTRVRMRMQQRMPAFVPHSLRELLGKIFEDLLRREVPQLLDQLGNDLAQKASSELKLAELIEKKLGQFDIKGLEEIVIGVAARELRHIEVLGAILGYIIGLIQVALLSIWGLR